ncbi:MAG TPA: hypothetical protein VJ797_07350 [Burkholderiales bacterium]|nr:hypothetical protein [Burkholderiales bacterium]
MAMDRPQPAYPTQPAPKPAIPPQPDPAGRPSPQPPQPQTIPDHQK